MKEKFKQAFISNSIRMKLGVCQRLRGTTWFEVGCEPDQLGSFNSLPTGLDDGIPQITGGY